MPKKKKGEKKEQSISPIMREERPFMSLREAMNRLFDESVWDPFESFADIRPFGGEGNYPKIDLSETAKKVKITADLPGIDPDDVDIELTDDSVVIKGETEKEEEKDDEEKKFYRYEREYGSFYREIPLPSPVKTDKVEAKSKNGVLTITLPKSKEEKKKKVKIKAEK